ncbi:MAG TPA: hypothetical protein GXX40_01075 [Firmicutes bacterium]|nr:hypothetical protein [Bacillota bacterium]
MKLDLRKIGIFVASFAVTTLLAIIVTMFVSKATVDNPLSAAYARLGFVHGFQLGKNGSKTRVIVEAGPVNDLRSAYLELFAKTASVIGDERFELVLKDTRDEQLSQAFNELSIYLQEGIATGKFSEMATAVQSATSASGIQSKLTVDSQNVYVMLVRGDRYLYEVIPRGVGDKK